MAFTGLIFVIIQEGIISINKHKISVPIFNKTIVPNVIETGATLTLSHYESMD